MCMRTVLEVVRDVFEKHLERALRDKEVVDCKHACHDIKLLLLHPGRQAQLVRVLKLCVRHAVCRREPVPSLREPRELAGGAREPRKEGGGGVGEGRGLLWGRGPEQGMGGPTMPSVVTLLVAFTRLCDLVRGQVHTLHVLYL